MFGEKNGLTNDDYFFDQLIDDVRPDKFKEECGVFGVFDNDEHDVARLSYYGLYALQHRGQESAGIAVNDNGTVLYHKDMGLVPEIFNDIVLNHLKGKIAIGHVRYSTTGASLRENAQPLVIKYRNGQLAIAHNGNLVNAKELRERLEDTGTIFQSTIDSEVILNLIARHRISCTNIEEAVIKTMEEIKGAYAIVMISPKKLIAARDPLGIRPLCLGVLGSSYIVASESCALDAVNAKFVRDINPGEILIIEETGINSIQTKLSEESKLCIFEHIYFARPDSIIDGASVHQSRIETGKRLWIEHPVKADIVIGVPDSGLVAAMGFAQASGIPNSFGLIKNRYVGRTFIKPNQEQRETSVQIKLNAIKSEVVGKRLVLIDDSIVRGTTSKRIVQLLREAGATEVHMRISSPPVKLPCFFGIDTPSRTQLIASNHSVLEINKMLGTDSLGFISMDGLLSTAIGTKCGFCDACFTGCYPMEVCSEMDKYCLKK